MLPDTFRTGIEELDNKYRALESQNLFNKGIQLLDIFQTDEQKRGVKNKLQKFKCFQKSMFEVPDLDILLNTDKPNFGVGKEVLPSLLTMFYLTNDPQLEDKILEIILSCFLQTSHLLEKLHKLEIIFDEKDKELYNVFTRLISSMRILSERSEIWLAEFMERLQAHQPDLNKTIDLLNQIHALFYENAKINQHGTVELPDGLLINSTRQKIFTFLNGHLPLLNLIKDAQNQLAKLLKLEYVPLHSKRVVFLLLRGLYKCLKNFCDNNTQNQQLLHEYIDEFFLDEINFDFGQFELLNTIFQNNKFLSENISDKIVNRLFQSIEQYGRQERFLNIFIVIMRREEPNGQVTYNIDNQLKVFKWFVPNLSQITDRNEVQRFQHILYSTLDKRKNQITFDLDIVDLGINVRCTNA